MTDNTTQGAGELEVREVVALGSVDVEGRTGYQGYAARDGALNLQPSAFPDWDEALSVRA